MIPENGKEAFEQAKGLTFDLYGTDEEHAAVWRFWRRAWNAALDCAWRKRPEIRSATEMRAMIHKLRLQEDS